MARRTDVSPHISGVSADSHFDNNGVDFYNYFQFGIDFLISGRTHVVQKIILHSNVVWLRNIVFLIVNLNLIQLVARLVSVPTL